jgi:hypothetical protein
MKPTTWFLPILILSTWVMEVDAQIFLPPGNGGGISFRYKSNRLSVSGYLHRGYPPGFYAVPVPVNPYYGPGPYYDPYYGPPAGIVENRTIIQVVNPPPAFAPASQRDVLQDVSGVDLDLISPPHKVGPGPDLPQGGEPKIPGEDVSKPKKVIRPEDVKKEQPAPPKPKPMPEQTRREKSNLQLELGAAAFRNAQYGLATQRFRLAAQIDDKNPMAYFLLAQGYFALHQYDEAVKAIQQGMDLDPLWPQAKFHPRLDLYKGIEMEFTAHLERLEKVAKANPKSETILFLLGYQLWFDGQQKRAQPVFQQARPLANDPAYIDQFLKAALPGVVAAK